jgi:hypothetical protein
MTSGEAAGRPVALVIVLAFVTVDGVPGPVALESVAVAE